MSIRLPSRQCRLSSFILLSASLLLGACAENGRVAGGAMPGPHITQAIPETGAKTEAGVPPTARELAADPGRFNGLVAHDVVAWLGDPNYRRHESPAEVWQYFGSSCVLDLFLYEEKGAQRVAHAEIRGRSLGQDADSACLTQMLNGRAKAENS